MYSGDHSPCLRTLGDSSGYLAQFATHLAALREGVILYPATTREGYAWRNRQGALHNASLLYEGAKTPIRITSQRLRSRTAADPEVMPLPYRELVGAANRMLNRSELIRQGHLSPPEGAEDWSWEHYLPAKSADLAPLTVTWLQQEVKNKTLRWREHRMLDKLSKNLQGRLSQYTED